MTQMRYEKIHRLNTNDIPLPDINSEQVREELKAFDSLQGKEIFK